MQSSKRLNWTECSITNPACYNKQVFHLDPGGHSENCFIPRIELGRKCTLSSFFKKFISFVSGSEVMTDHSNMSFECKTKQFTCKEERKQMYINHNVEQIATLGQENC